MSSGGAYEFVTTERTAFRAGAHLPQGYGRSVSIYAEQIHFGCDTDLLKVCAYGQLSLGAPREDKAGPAIGTIHNGSQRWRTGGPETIPSALKEKHFNLMCIAEAAGLGALAGGVGALPFLALPVGAGLLAFAGAGSLGGVFSYGVNCLDGAEKNPSWGGLAGSVALGGVFGGWVRVLGISVRVLENPPN